MNKKEVRYTRAVARRFQELFYRDLEKRVLKPYPNRPMVRKLFP